MQKITPPPCYQLCNQRYTAMQPQRLFCKKGCDFDEDLESCRNDHCNKLCIKEEQGQQKLWFKFLYRASGKSAICLQSCIQGCLSRQTKPEES